MSLVCGLLVMMSPACVMLFTVRDWTSLITSSRKALKMTQSIASR